MKMAAVLIQDRVKIPVEVSELSQNNVGTWTGSFRSAQQVNLKKLLHGNRGILKFDDGREGTIALIIEEANPETISFIVFGGLGENK